MVFRVFHPTVATAFTGTQRRQKRRTCAGGGGVGPESPESLTRFFFFARAIAPRTNAPRRSRRATIMPSCPSSGPPSSPRRLPPRGP
eukprot:30989-Pelagococcus_subviridis.AAC.5